ncbi:ADP-ribosylglycohydrolase family protein [Streptomyces griseoincarnatus]|uniref:ADP-ribosylglycohydrolase family protein n=1 Tax=Streptomyces sp. PAM3C TaxID=2847300 RepID=UPI0020A69053|nr:ADP-ribosylglycohydrolase family protein [Streptomyces sp. PAM3C]
MADEKDRRRKFRRLESRLRGMMLGLALGDTMGTARGEPPASGPLRAGVSTQLACFTAEGTIRAMVRMEHKGICHPPSVVLHAYCRWAALQGIETERMRRRWASGTGEGWPDGWLAGVPVLAERRGSAPATVAALSRIDERHEQTAIRSRGCHSLTRALPISAIGKEGAALAGETAALTHGDAAAWSATVRATALLHHCLTNSPEEAHPPVTADQPVREALRTGIAVLPPLGRGDVGNEHDHLITVFRHAVEQPADAGVLARLAPDATAPSALYGGLYAALSFPHRAGFATALRFAAGAPDGDSVACVTGALLGAVHGIEALPVDLVSRHELSWVLDTLARDLLLQTLDSPSGSEYVEGWDPHWWSRYPGW